VYSGQYDEVSKFDWKIVWKLSSKLF